MGSKSTPLGVIIIAVLMLIGGILDILGGIGVFLAFSVMPMPLPGFLSGFGVVMGALYIIWGIIIIAAALSLLKLEHWAWTFVVVVNIITLVLDVIFFNAIGFIIALIVVVYMFYRRDVFQ